MKTLDIALLGRLLLAGILVGCNFGLTAPAQAAPKKVLVVTVTLGFRHSSIPTAEKVIAELAKESSAFTVDYAYARVGYLNYCAQADRKSVV